MSLGLLALLMAHWIRQQILSSCSRGHHTSKERSRGQNGSPVRLMSWDHQRLPAGKKVTEAFDRAAFLNGTPPLGCPHPLLSTKFYFQPLPLTNPAQACWDSVDISFFITRHKSSLAVVDVWPSGDHRLPHKGLRQKLCKHRMVKGIQAPFKILKLFWLTLSLKIHWQKQCFKRYLHQGKNRQGI